MKSQENIIKLLEKICQKHKKYKIDAYTFVLTALNYTMEKLKRKGHLAGKELLEGIKDFAIQEYGRMSKTVFEHWGVKNTEDFGQIVFNMVEEGILGKTEADSINDFRNVYDFKQVFEKNFKY